MSKGSISDYIKYQSLGRPYDLDLRHPRTLFPNPTSLTFVANLDCSVVAGAIRVAAQLS